uniref:Uncharacterized protein n=1 Tax=Arundo donax TaxID=35708 RepID=A0A0A9HZ58_ARUDO
MASTSYAGDVGGSGAKGVVADETLPASSSYQGSHDAELDDRSRPFTEEGLYN